jgi:hypothetical protein
MMTSNRKLPVGIQNFEKLRTENFLYVDKTQYLYRLATLSVPCFLARPRRYWQKPFSFHAKSLFSG